MHWTATKEQDCFVLQEWSSDGAKSWGPACSAASSDREALEHPLGSHLGHPTQDLKGADG